MNLFIRIRNEKMNKLVFILINIKINKLKKKKIIRKHFFFFFGFRGRPDGFKCKFFGVFTRFGILIKYFVFF